MEHPAHPASVHLLPPLEERAADARVRSPVQQAPPKRGRPSFSLPTDSQRTHMLHQILCFMMLPLAMGMAHSQAVTPAVAPLQLIGETLRNISISFFGNERTWKDYRETKLTRTEDARGSWLYAFPGGSQVIFHPESAVQMLLPNGYAEPPTVSETSTRSTKELTTGQKWTVDRVNDFAPVDWCANTKGRVVSNFEVAAPEDYPILLDGKSVVLKVIPVIENGYWERCYQGKRFTKVLISPEYKTVVSIEHIGYRPTGQTHESSYRLNVKEIKTGADK